MADATVDGMSWPPEHTRRLAMLNIREGLPPQGVVDALRGLWAAVPAGWSVWVRGHRRDGTGFCGPWRGVPDVDGSPRLLVVDPDTRDLTAVDVARLGGVAINVGPAPERTVEEWTDTLMGGPPPLDDTKPAAEG